ncbi:MAG: FABP family protein [Bdellovibrionales bacterium]|nr:FABP family protein [Bdellovibrionales bacterium]
MDYKEYGPLAYLVGRWQSQGWTGENRAPDEDRQVENTKFRQEMTFEPVGEIENHEQLLMALEYKTRAWEEGDEDNPFHQEVGYFLWDAANKQVMKTFVIPRGISVNTGGTAEADAKKFTLAAKVGSDTYGICSNIFLDEEFKSMGYEVTFEQVDSHTLSYYEDTLIKIKGQTDIFHHIEKNILKKQV